MQAQLSVITTPSQGSGPFTRDLTILEGSGPFTGDVTILEDHVCVHWQCPYTFS